MRRGGGRDSGFELTRQRAIELLASLTTDSVAPVYLFYGDDDFQRDSVVRRALQTLCPSAQRETSLTVLSGEAVTPQQVAAELESSGFNFGDEPRRVVLVRDCNLFAQGAPGAPDLLCDRLKSGLLADVTVVFDVRGKIDRRQKLTKTVLEVGVALEFSALGNEDDAATLLQSRLRRAGKTMRRAALSLLVERTGLDAQALSNDVEKLIAYVGTDEEITADDVRAMVAPTAELSVFDLVDAVADRKPREALAQLEALLAQQAEPFMILAMLTRQFRLLLQARHLLDTDRVPSRMLRLRPFEFNQQLQRKDGDRTLLETWKQELSEVFPQDGKRSLLGQHYFPFWKTLAQAQRLETPAIEAAFERLLQADLGFKTSHLAPSEEIELLVIDLCIRIEVGATVPYERLLDV